jgi:hypothetical protein
MSIPRLHASPQAANLQKPSDSEKASDDGVGGSSHQANTAASSNQQKSSDIVEQKNLSPLVSIFVSWEKFCFLIK